SKWRTMSARASVMSCSSRVSIRSRRRSRSAYVPMTAGRITRADVTSLISASGYLSCRPDEAAVAAGVAEGDQFLHRERDLAGVEAGAGGQLVGVGRFTGERFEDRLGGATGRRALRGARCGAPEAAGA